MTTWQQASQGLHAMSICIMGLLHERHAWIVISVTDMTLKAVPSEEKQPFCDTRLIQMWIDSWESRMDDWAAKSMRKESSTQGTMLHALPSAGGKGHQHLNKRITSPHSNSGTKTTSVHADFMPQLNEWTDAQRDGVRYWCKPLI